MHEVSGLLRGQVVGQAQQPKNEHHGVLPRPSSGERVDSDKAQMEGISLAVFLTSRRCKSGLTEFVLWVKFAVENGLAKGTSRATRGVKFSYSITKKG